jgi:ABC-2 type transport system ATP-binding protein
MLEIHNLQKVVDGQTVVDIDSLIIEADVIAGFTGPVDSQLGLIFNLLTGQERPSSGSIRISGIEPYQERNQFSRLVGVVFAEDNLYTRQSVLANLNFYRRLYQLPQSRVNEIIAMIGLADQADAIVETLNPSMVRRLAFGRAILHDPTILLLNEPFKDCDPATINLLSALIQDLSKAGVTILLISHEEQQINELAGVVYQFDQGHVVGTYIPTEGQRERMPFKIPAKLEHTVALVDPADIYYAFAQDDRTFLQTEEGSLPTQFTMAELEKRLSRSGFFRAHRSYLVNLQLVNEVIPYTRDSFSLRLKDPQGTKIPLSKNAARELRELMGY